MATALEREGPVWLLEIQIQGEQTEAMVDTGASRSFVAPSKVAKVKRPTDERMWGLDFVLHPAVSWR